jgi:hypothetical protein
MKHKKILVSVTLGLIVAVLSLTNLVSAANLNQAVATLPSNEEWSIMAKASIGQNAGHSFLKSKISGGSATDYEKRILAITAIGENPRTFGEEDFIAKLETFFDGNQIGDPSLLNDDIFGVLAFSSAGILNNITSKERGHILSRQNSDGGWGFASGVGSDSNTTAMAIAALEQLGSIPDSAFNYLASTEDSSGGYAFIPGTPADGASTAWVITGLRTARKNIPANAAQFLDSLQTSNGSFKWKPGDSSGSSLVTAYAVIALSGRGIPVKTVNTNPPVTPPTPPVTPPTPPPSITEVQLCIHINYDGGCEGFPLDDANLSNNQVGNDNASSIRVPAGKIAALFEHINFQGRCEEFKTHDPDLRNNFVGNDMPSSITIGKSCPIIVPPQPPAPPVVVPPIPPAPSIVHVTLTYPGNKIYVGDISYTTNLTALQAMQSSANQINLLYEIKQTGLGQFVQNINGYGNSGTKGWQYAVNGTVPTLGAAEYILHSNDKLQWFYGEAGSSPF